MNEVVEIISEREEGSSWVFEVAVGGNAGARSLMTLAWIDYDWWAPGGRCTPSNVALAVAKTYAHSLGAGGMATLPPKFDASVVRRRVAGADALIASCLGAPQ